MRDELREEATFTGQAGAGDRVGSVVVVETEESGPYKRDFKGMIHRIWSLVGYQE